MAATAGEMRVNLGGDPGRDDYGLPPVDIEIPDDARELDREVQAYHRELRAMRWRRRTRGWHRPLTRDGMVLPLLAGCLALTLLAGTLLTVFTGEQITMSNSGQPGHQLPDALVMMGGNEVPMADLRGSVLALVPPRCGCAHLRQLAQEASRAGVEIYVVGTQGVQVDALVKQVPLDPTHALEDTGGDLYTAYHPVTLTAVLVNLNGSVAKVVPDHGQGFALAPEIRALIPGNRGAAPQPSGSGAAASGQVWGGALR